MTDLVSILSPHSCRPIRLGGQPGLSPADISHACTMSRDIGFILICIKYSGDLSGYADLNRLLYERIMDEARDGNWKKSRLPGLVKLAVGEYCSTVILSDKERARALKVHPSVWLRIWREKYNRLMEILDSYEHGTLHLIRNRLK